MLRSEWPDRDCQACNRACTIIPNYIAEKPPRGESVVDNDYDVTLVRCDATELIFVAYSMLR